jgi:hypothetical protein
MGTFSDNNIPAAGNHCFRTGMKDPLMVAVTEPLISPEDEPTSNT